MAKYTKENGYNKAYVLYLAGDYYCEILKDGYVAEAAVQGFDVVVESYLSGYGYSYWDKIISGGYKCVYIAGYYNDVHNIIKTGYALGYTGVCYGCDGWDGLIDQFAVGEDVSYLEKCFYICQFNAKSNNEEVKKFVTAYQNKYNGEVPLTFAALGYDSVYIAKQAIEKSGSADYDKVIEALTNSTFSGLVTSNGEFKFVDGNPQKKPFIISFKGNMEVVVE